MFACTFITLIGNMSLDTYIQCCVCIYDYYVCQLLVICTVLGGVLQHSLICW